MSRVLVGLVVCLAVGAGVAVSGLGRLLSLDEAFAPPRVPAALAALPQRGRVDVTLVPSPGLLEALADGVSDGGIAMHRPGALALVDGRVFATSGASTRSVLEALAWDELPIDARQASVAELDRFAAPAAAPAAWRARLHLHRGLRAARDIAARRPSFVSAALLTAVLLLLHAFVRALPPRSAGAAQPEPSPWRRRRAQPPVRVVLVSDADTLHLARVAIGEEHVVAATGGAFAFADGWILAARKGSVFELVGELGWHLRPLEIASRSDLADEGRPLAPDAGRGAHDTLELIEALHVCGPVAHGGPTPPPAGAFGSA